MTITDVTIPYASYKEADDLSKLVLEKTETIGEAAFEYCHNLSSVVFPKTLKSIGTAAFQSCTDLNKLSYLPG